SAFAMRAGADSTCTASSHCAIVSMCVSRLIASLRSPPCFLPCIFGLGPVPVRDRPLLNPCQECRRLHRWRRTRAWWPVHFLAYFSDDGRPFVFQLLNANSLRIKLSKRRSARAFSI